MSQRNYYFSSDGYRSGPTHYLVYPSHLTKEQRHNERLCLGAITSATPRRYPGRNRSSYYAKPIGSDSFFSTKRRGPFPSRRDAAEALFVYMSTYRYGKQRLARIRDLAPSKERRLWSPARKGKRS